MAGYQKSIDVISSATTTAELNQNIQPKESLKDIIPRINDFWGEIKEIKGQTIVVEARIADISKLDQFDESKGTSFPMITKQFNVVTNQETVFSFKKLTELKTGDHVSVFSKKPIYGVDEFVATYITYLTEENLSILH